MAFSGVWKWRLFAVAMAAAGSLGSAKPLARADAMEPVAPGEVIPVIDFFRPAMFQRPRINSAGTLIAALNPDSKGSINLVVFDPVTSAARSVGGGEGLDVFDFNWLDENRLLFRVSKNQRYAQGLFAADARALNQAIPLNRQEVAIPVAYPRRDPLRPIVWLRKTARMQGEDQGVVQMDSRRNVDLHGDTAIVKTFRAPEGGVPIGYYPDANGELSYAVTARDEFAMLHRLIGEQWERCAVDLDEIDVAGAGDRAGELIGLVRSKESDTRRPASLWRLDAATGELGAVLHQDETYEPRPVRFHRRPADGRIIGISFDRKGPETLWLDPVYAQMQQELARALPGGVVWLVGSDDSENQFLVYLVSDTLPGRYYLFQRRPAKLERLWDSRPWLDQRRMQPM